MYLSKRLYSPLAAVDDDHWQRLLASHAFWKNPGVSLDEDHRDIAFHILMEEGALGLSNKKLDAAFEFDAVPIPAPAFEDPALCAAVQHWSDMHAGNYGPGVTTKMGFYVIRAGGTLGFHVDGPVFLRGARADLSSEGIQRGLMEVQASHRTILPLQFNVEDRFMLCGYKAPLKRGELFEFSNVLPHAYFNRGAEHAVLLVTTYLEEELLPQEVTYSSVESGLVA
ncbi:hypothetical protein [Variovorax terrae]|uniref:Aspartyl/asparaginy/proline hydroxylase domain-containing protein n=1 Tax=Variovorax terrae TaxID=2923278 RepID=A0A9X1VYH5_9BURK|nr:hypothetical protein [Variovorax terrae]MCJ0764504.1 hypothetical protein [Variovorax terrae]